jgi:hypothetical protein
MLHARRRRRVLSALLFSNSVLKGRARPMILELPAYQVPSIRNALLTARDQGLSFLKTAGTVIMAICVVMWWLSAYPKVAPPPEAVALRAQAAAVDVTPEQAQALQAQASGLEARAQQSGSIAGRAGRAIQPIFAPLGYDWQLSVGLLTSFVAREVFVSTMAVLAGVGDDETRVIQGVRTMKRDDGRPVFTPATAASALVFFVLAMQCLPTLAGNQARVGQREVGRATVGIYVVGRLHRRVHRFPGADRAGHVMTQDLVVTLIAFVIVAGFAVRWWRRRGRHEPACASCESNGTKSAVKVRRGPHRSNLHGRNQARGFLRRIRQAAHSLARPLIRVAHVIRAIQVILWRQMRAYISGALLNAADLEQSRALYERFADACRAAGWDAYVPHQHADPVRDSGMSNVDVATAISIRSAQPTRWSRMSGSLLWSGRGGGDCPGSRKAGACSLRSVSAASRGSCWASRSCTRRSRDSIATIRPARRPDGLPSRSERRHDRVDQILGHFAPLVFDEHRAAGGDGAAVLLQEHRAVIAAIEVARELARHGLR